VDLKLLVTSDWQCALGNLDRCEIMFLQIMRIMLEREVPVLLHCGDIKDALNPVDTRVTNFLVYATREIRNRCNANFLFLRGNHDSITAQDDVPSCLPQLKAAGADVADEDFKVTGFPYHINLWRVPYFRDPERQRKAFKVAEEDARSRPSIKILAFHNELAGCKRSAYSKGKGLTLEDIGAKYYDLCIGGHIHAQQQVSKLPNVWYVGSPFCCDWGEVNQSKGFLLIDVPDRIQGKENRRRVTVEQIPSVAPGWYDPNAPGFRKPESWKGCRVRVKVPVTSDPTRELQEARNRLEKRYAGAVVHLVPEFQNAAVKPDSVDTKAGDDQLLHEYLSKIPMPEGYCADQAETYLKKFLPATGLFGVQGVKFENVTADDVLCFKRVALNLDQKGLTLVTGRNLDWSDQTSNGAGKSSLVSLAFLALFGRTFKGQTHDGWAAQNSKAVALVTQRLSLPDKSSLLIQRGRRPALLRVFRNGKEITMGDANATQALIERLTNLTWDVLTNSVYVGQREIGSVFGTEKERKELFSRLLGLDRFLEAQAKLKKEVLKARRSVEAVEQEIASVNAALAEANTGRKEIEQALAEAPPVNEAGMADSQLKIMSLEQAIRKRELENQALEPTLEKNQKAFELLLSSTQKFEGQTDGLREQLEAALKVKGKCPTCGSAVTVKALEAYTKILEEQIAGMEEQIERYEKLQQENRTARRVIIEKIQANNLENRKATISVDSLQREVLKWKEQADARKRLEAVLRQKDARVAKLEFHKAVHEGARSACVEHENFLTTCERVVGRDGLPAYLASVAVPQLNSAAARYSELFADGEIGVRFSASGGDVDVEVSNLHGGSGIKDQSMGEMRMAGLISAFAFRETLVPMGILVLDEPGEGLDAVNAERFARGLNQIADKFGSVYCISHNERVLAALEPDRRLEVVKQNGVATVREI
jgi:DNA repair exonuclease SbcCD nuclease subunit